MAVTREQGLSFPGVPPKGKDHRPSQRDTDAANSGQLAPKGAEKFLQRVANSWAVRIGLTAGAFTIVYEAVPAIHQTVDNTAHDILRKLGLEVVVPTTFDNKLNKGSVGDSNIKLISQEEAKKRNLQPVENDTSLMLLFPFQPPKGIGVQYEKTLSAALTPEVRIEATQKNIQDIVKVVLPKSTPIYASVNGRIIAESSQRTAENQNSADGAKLFYYDEVKNRTYVLLIGSTDPNAFDSLVPTQRTEPSAWIGTSWEQLPNIEQGTPILKTTKDNQLVSLYIKAYEGKVVGPQAELIDKTFYAVSLQFLTTIAPEGQKILVLGK